MLSASNAFIDALRWGSLVAAAQITLLDQVGNPTSVVLPVSAASFTVDRNSEQRRQGELTVEVVPIVPPQTVAWNAGQANLLPLTPQDPLAPFGQQVQVAVSIASADLNQVIKNSDGSVAASTWANQGWVSLGTYVIASSEVDDTTTDLTCSLSLYDRSWLFSQWALKSNYTVPAADGSLMGEVKALLAYVWNNNGPGFLSGAAVPPWISSSANFQGGSSWTCASGAYQQGQDPWQACLEMAASAGYELFFDVPGNLTAKPIPGSPAGGKLSSLPVVWNFTENELSATGLLTHPIGGTPYTTPVGVRVKMTRDGVSNDYFVSATGPNNSSGGPVQAQAADQNPQSPTHVSGGIGDVPTFVYDSLITSESQALTEAQYDLGVSIGAAWTVAVTHILHPLFDIDDVCSVTNARQGLSAKRFITDTVQVDIRYDAHTVVSGRIIMPGS